MWSLCAALHLFPCTGLKWKYIHLSICQCHYSLQTHQGIKFTSRLSEISQVHQDLMSRFTLQLKTPSPNGWTTESNKGYCSKMVRPLSAAIYSVLRTKACWVSHVFFWLQDHNEIFIYPLYTNVHAQTYISHVALIIEVSLLSLLNLLGILSCMLPYCHFVKFIFILERKTICKLKK